MPAAKSRKTRNQKNPKVRGVVTIIRRDFGVGGVGYIEDEGGVEHFFHSRHVQPPGYGVLQVGSVVKFRRIRARGAMGAGAQARDIEEITLPGSKDELEHS